VRRLHGGPHDGVGSQLDELGALGGRQLECVGQPRDGPWMGSLALVALQRLETGYAQPGSVGQRLLGESGARAQGTDVGSERVVHTGFWLIVSRASRTVHPAERGVGSTRESG